MPIDWANYVDNRLYTTDYDMMLRYKTMLYYGILNLGINEFGPVNRIEYMYLIVTLIVSSLLSALLFGDISSYIEI